MVKKSDKTCIYFRGLEDCLCNNSPDDPGECVYEQGIEPSTPSMRCPHYISAAASFSAMPKNKIAEITERENALYRCWGGRIPEANDDLNNLQREKIAAVFEESGAAYIGRINHSGEERASLTADKVFDEYKGQMVYNFGADFVLCVTDDKLAELIVQWNKGGLPTSLKLIEQIINRINFLGGINLLWS